MRMPLERAELGLVVSRLQECESAIQALERRGARRSLASAEEAEFRNLNRRRGRLAARLAELIHDIELPRDDSNKTGRRTSPRTIEPRSIQEKIATTAATSQTLTRLAASQTVNEPENKPVPVKGDSSSITATESARGDTSIERNDLIESGLVDEVDGLQLSKGGYRSVPNLSDALSTRLPDIFSRPSFTSAGLRPLDPQFFVETFVAISGSEIEAEEIRLGVILGPLPQAGTQLVPAALIPKDLKPLPTADATSIISYLRNEVLPRSVGTKVLVMSPDRLEAYGVYQVGFRSSAGAASLTAGGVLEAALQSITQNPSYLALLMKDARSIRIYKNDVWIAQLISVRDGLGWSLRIARELQQWISRLVRERLGNTISDQVASTLAYLAMEISEVKKGGSVFVIPEETNLSDFGPAAWNAEVYGSPISYHFGDMLELMQQDGALVIRASGVPVASGVYFSGEGGRKRIARQVCAGAIPAVALVVSQDGYIQLNGFADMPAGQSFEVDVQRYRAG